MVRKFLLRDYFILLSDFLTQNAFYYDDILCLKKNVDTDEYSCKAEAEHVYNRIYLHDFLKVQEYTKEDFRELARLRLGYLKYLYPDLPVIVYLFVDENGYYIIDFGLEHQNDNNYRETRYSEVECFKAFDKE